MENKKKKKKIGLRARTLLYLLGFSTMLIVLLWVLLTALLGSIYRFAKKRQAAGVMREINEIVTSENVTIGQLNEAAHRNDVRLLIAGTDGVLYYTSSSMFEAFSTIAEIPMYYEGAVANGGSLMVYVDGDARFLGIPGIDSSVDEETGEFTGEFRVESFQGKRGDGTSLISVMLTDMNETEVMIVVTTLITPVEATVGAIRLVLFVISILMILISVLTAFLLSRQISRPILTITKHAEQLATADYSVVFPDSTIKEISGLSDTLNNTVQELRKTERLQHELIANVSHDLRTPLTMIKGYAEMMRDLPDENSPENLQVVIDETERLNGLVTDLLDVSRMQANVSQVVPREYCLTDSIERVLTRYEKLVAGGYVIDFIYRDRVFVEADEEKIFQVLYNLINNAINYTDDSKEVQVIQEIEGDRVKIMVRDHGMGINEEDKKHIWERYYRSNENHKIAKVGTGLGLSIAKNVLDLHHAEYGVDSVSGEGSTFWFALSVLRVDDTEEGETVGHDE